VIVYIMLMLKSLQYKSKSIINAKLDEKYSEMLINVRWC